MNLSRREFIIGGGASALTGSSALAETPRRQEDKTNTISFTPERLKKLERVLFGIAGWQLEQLENGDKVSMASLRQLLSALPGYSKLEISIPKLSTRNQREMIIQLLDSTGVNYRLFVSEASNWVQDMGIPITQNGRVKMLIPGAVGREEAIRGDALLEAELLVKIFGTENIVQAPFNFDGGNIKFEFFNGKAYVFVGRDVVWANQDSDQLTTQRVEEVLSRLSNYFNGAKVVMLGKEEIPQAETFAFHIDQSVLFVDEGLAAVAEISYSEKEIDTSIDTILKESENKLLKDVDNAKTNKEDAVDAYNLFLNNLANIRIELKNFFLDKLTKHIAQAEKIKSTLRGLGYSVIEIPHSTTQMLKSQSHMNSILYTHRHTQKKGVILTVFFEQLSENVQHEIPSRLTREHLTGNALEAFDRLGSLGLEVTPVLDVNYLYDGNLHCVTRNVADLPNDWSLKGMFG